MSSDITFHTKDKFGNILPDTLTDVITGYTGNLFPITFVAYAESNEDSVFSKSLISWDFGDTNESTGLSATHIYNTPGEYQVTLNILDKFGKPHTSNTVKTLKLYNVIGDELVWRLSSSETPVVTAGKLSEPLSIERYNSWQSYNALSANNYYTVNLYASGSPSNYYNAKDDINTKYSQYLKIWKFVESSSNVTPIETLSTAVEPIYYKLLNPGTSAVKCTPDDLNAVLVGTSGANTVHYVDDNYKETGLINLVASLDMSDFPSTYSQLNRQLTNSIDTGLEYLNHSVATLPVSSTHNTPTQLVFTSNGIKGFNIKSNKWQYSPISYVISLADDEGNILKGYPALSGGRIDQNYQVEQGFVNTDYNDITYYTPSGINIPTYGSLTNIATVSSLTSNESITARCNIVDHLGVTRLISGTSNTFNIYPASGEYLISKVNEDFDFTSTLKSFVLQESLTKFQTQL